MWSVVQVLFPFRLLLQPFLLVLTERVSVGVRDTIIFKVEKPLCVGIQTTDHEIGILFDIQTVPCYVLFSWSHKQGFLHQNITCWDTMIESPTTKSLNTLSP